MRCKPLHLERPSPRHKQTNTDSYTYSVQENTIHRMGEREDRKSYPVYCGLKSPMQSELDDRSMEVKT